MTTETAQHILEVLNSMVEHRVETPFVAIHDCLSWAKRVEAPQVVAFGLRLLKFAPNLGDAREEINVFTSLAYDDVAAKWAQAADRALAE